MSSLERVKRIVIDVLGVEDDQIKEDSSFIDDLGADSLDLVELIMEFEEEFGVEVSDEEAETWLLVSDAVKAADRVAAV